MPPEYRLILLAQCRHLAKPMPWLFDTRLHGGVDLLLPEHLLATDSLVRGLVNGIPEEDWKQGVEIIGWLYQFFISERKDEVMGAVVAPEDIPAATQLFTPNWIVQYLVQNSVGRLWIESNPTSKLRQSMPYFVESPDLNSPIRTPTTVGRAPESFTILDPACGSGHILLESFRLLFDIYLERGYRQREIPVLIFSNNLFGLDIDDRSAQLACMCLLFEARRHDKTILIHAPKLNIYGIQSGVSGEISSIQGSSFGRKSEAKDLINCFSEGKILGSLLQLSDQTSGAIPFLKEENEKASASGDIFLVRTSEILSPLIAQAEIIARKFDVVVANPPYMGRKYHVSQLRSFSKDAFPCSQNDLYAMFIERAILYCNNSGYAALITMDTWLHGEDFKETRARFIEMATFESLCHLGPHAFPEVKGEVVQVAAFVSRSGSNDKGPAKYYDLTNEPSSEEKRIKFLAKGGEHVRLMTDFASVPRSVFTAYRASKAALDVFAHSCPLESISEALTGLQTGDNPRFIRYWHEVARDSIEFNCKSENELIVSNKQWFPYVKGSDYRKWYGNQSCIVNWKNGGSEIRSHRSATVRNSHKYFSSGIAYNNISKNFCARLVGEGFIFDQKNSMFFSSSPDAEIVTLGLLHSSAIQPYLEIFSPKDFNPGALKIIPVPKSLICDSSVVLEKIKRLVKIHKDDWDSFETSWDFTQSPLLADDKSNSLKFCWIRWIKESESRIQNAVALEQELNEYFINAYGLQAELSSIVSDEFITLYKCIRGDNGEPDPREDVRRLLSYGIGCIMGRYSLDVSGIAYAGMGSIGFDHNVYKYFSADDDGIVPITDEAWFSDDATERLVDFISSAWNKSDVDTNINFIADSLGKKSNESPKETIRRYFASGFYKDHCQTYKRRPVYWLFSSGKMQAFQCLVYMHRYNGDTLGRMRADYVIPLQSKLQGRLAALTEEVASAGSTAQRKQAQKALDLIDKKIRELATFDDQLRSYADKRIELDLDDGVKVNICKFGTLIDLKPLGNLDSEE